MKPITTVLIVFFAVIVSFTGHEAAHYIAGRAQGHPMQMTFNSAYSSDQHVEQSDATLIDAAGPLFSILQALAAFLLLQRTKKPVWYPFVLVPTTMRILATLLSIHNPNDEARVGMALGIGTCTLPILVSCFLIGVSILAAKQISVPRKWHALNIVSVIVFSITLILLDHVLFTS